MPELQFPELAIPTVSPIEPTTVVRKLPRARAANVDDGRIPIWAPKHPRAPLQMQGPWCLYGTRANPWQNNLSTCCMSPLPQKQVLTCRVPLRSSKPRPWKGSAYVRPPPKASPPRSTDLHMKLGLLLTGRCSSIRNRTLTNDYNSSSWALCPPIPDLAVHTTVTPWSVPRAPFHRQKERKLKQCHFPPRGGLLIIHG